PLWVVPRGGAEIVPRQEPEGVGRREGQQAAVAVVGDQVPPPAGGFGGGRGGGAAHYPGGRAGLPPGPAAPCRGGRTARSPRRTSSLANELSRFTTADGVPPTEVTDAAPGSADLLRARGAGASLGGH